MSEQTQFDWSTGSYIRSDTDYLEEESFKEELLNFAWFTVKANMSPTKEEEHEKIEAIKEQIRQGVIQPNGMPVGMGNNINVQMKKKKGGGSAARQARRYQEKQRKKQLKNLQKKNPLLFHRK